MAEASSPATADHFTDRILERCHRISEAPLGGTPRPELGRALRSVPFDRRTTIVYRVVDKRVIVAGIFYGGQDIAARMRRHIKPG